MNEKEIIFFEAVKIAIVDLLIEHGNMKDTAGETAFDYAEWNSFLDLCEMISKTKEELV